MEQFKVNVQKNRVVELNGKLTPIAAAQALRKSAVVRSLAIC
jgi:hypothetical protein